VAVSDQSLASDARAATFSEAEPLLLEGSQALQQSGKPSSDHKRDALVRIVRLYKAWDKPDKLAASQQKLADFDRATAVQELSLKFRQGQKLDQAVPLLREAVELSTKLGSAPHGDTIALRIDLADTLRDLNQPAEAEPLYREALEIARKRGANDPDTLEHRLIHFADIVHSQAKFAESEPLLREVVEHIKLHPDGEKGRGSSSVASLASLLADWAWAERGPIAEVQNLKPEVTARAKEAERLLRDCLAERLQGPIADYWRTDEFRSRLGAALISVAVTDPSLTSEVRLAKLTEAERLLVSSNEALQQSDTADKRYKRDVLVRLVRLYEAWEKPEKAAEWQKKVDKFDKANAVSESGPQDDQSRP
jgi:tetratricopeptide (TPR) repeat protein